MVAQGVYVGNSPSALQDYESWMGAKPTYVLNALNQSSWSAFDSSIPYEVNLWKNVSEKLILGVPLVVDGASLEQAAAHAYDSHYLAAAKALAAGQSGSGPIYVRTGWEFNGNWMPWAAQGKEAAFVKAYQNLVDTFRSVSDRFRFVWDVNIGQNMNPATAYPGDKYVDVVGMDAYYNSAWDSADPAKAFSNFVGMKYGLQWQQDFAAAHGKPTALSEWGVEGNNTGPLVTKMADWMNDHNMVYENYWNSNDAYPGRLDQGQYPATANAYKAAFGPGTSGSSSGSTAGATGGSSPKATGGSTPGATGGSSPEATGGSTPGATDGSPAGPIGGSVAGGTSGSVTGATDGSSPNKAAFGSIVNDVTSTAGKIYALFQTILGRAPDPVVFENQVAAANAGTPLPTIAQSLLDSSEYAATHGSSASSNSGYVDQLYRDGLRRAVDAGAQATIDALNTGTQTRAQVALSIATSQESSNILAPTFQAGVFVPDASDAAVARLYYGLLNRAPDVAGLQSAGAAMDAGASIGQVAQSFLGSGEYANGAVGQDNLAYVQGLYQTALGRVGDAGGLQGYQNALQTGAHSRADVADAFLTSNEFQSREAHLSDDSYIGTVYQAALGRPVDPDGLASWDAQLAGGASRSDVARNIVASDEFATHATRPGQATFVTALYEGALGRAPGSSEVLGWQTAFAGGATLASVATGIAESSEAMSHLTPNIEAGFHTS